VETQLVYPNFLQSRSAPDRKERRKMLRIRRNVKKTTSPQRTTTTALHTTATKLRKTKMMMKTTKNVRFRQHFTNTDDVIDKYE
jgi:hypothetical protein